MQEWKKNVMQEVGYEIEIIKQTYEGLIEAKKRSFKLELEQMEEKVEQLELEIQILKALYQQSINKIPIVGLGALLVGNIQK